jgi:hypothetical protein
MMLAGCTKDEEGGGSFSVIIKFGASTQLSRSWLGFEVGSQWLNVGGKVHVLNPDHSPSPKIFIRLAWTQRGFMKHLNDVPCQQDLPSDLLGVKVIGHAHMDR